VSRQIGVTGAKYVVSDDLPPGPVTPRMRIAKFAFKMTHSYCFQP